MDKDGTRVVEYTYDSWGKPLSRTGSLKNTLGYLQPFRYRGYIYDLDTGLYYLRSRYYSPDKCRFINADALIKGNLFGYCSNNIITRVDDNGLDSHLIQYVIDSSGKNPNHFYDITIGIGRRATVQTGVIRIDLTIENNQIYSLIQEGYSLNTISAVIAQEACDKYYQIFGEEFILTRECVSFEIKEHIIAYQYSIGQRIFPNAIAFGYQVVQGKGIEGVKKACESIDICEKDVKIDNLFSQSSIFNYKNGINPIYIGTPRDPWGKVR